MNVGIRKYKEACHSVLIDIDRPGNKIDLKAGPLKLKVIKNGDENTPEKYHTKALNHADTPN